MSYHWLYIVTSGFTKDIKRKIGFEPLLPNKSNPVFALFNFNKLWYITYQDLGGNEGTFMNKGQFLHMILYLVIYKLFIWKLYLGTGSRHCISCNADVQEQIC